MTKLKTVNDRQISVRNSIIIRSNNKEYNQRLRTLSHSDSQEDELKKMREDIDELKYLLKKLVNVKQT